MSFGIPLKGMNLILEALSNHPEIERASIFGSRAMGNYKRGSDVDLVIYGAQVTEDTCIRLSLELNEELPLPYFFDVVHYETLENRELKNHIDSEGIKFYCN